MLEINLIPNELRKKAKGFLFPPGFKIPLEIVIGSAGGLILLLILLHICLIFVNINNIAQYNSLKKKWEEILPQKNDVDVVLGELRQLKSKRDAVAKVSNQKQIIWAQKLNLVSDALTKGVWIRKISLIADLLSIEGSAISRQNDEMINVHSFASSLKDIDSFLSDLTELELGSIQRRSIKNLEIADFLIKAKIKVDNENKLSK